MINDLTAQEYLDQQYPKSEKFLTQLFFTGPLSNWWYSPFTLDDVKYNCVEQFMMAQKAILFNDYVTLQRIMDCDSLYINQATFVKHPRMQKKLGRQVKNFNATKWKEEGVELIIPGVVAKFEQNQELNELLRLTTGYTLVEASPYDPIWGVKLGIGNPDAYDPSKWRGLNELGHMLSFVRDIKLTD